jgi:aldose 1-epimerase
MERDPASDEAGGRLDRGQFLRGAAVGGAAFALSLGSSGKARAQPVTGAGAYLPTGGQFEIFYGDQSAIVTEVGATLRSYAVAGFETMDTFGIDESSDSSRGQVLLPFPNRIDGGKYTFEGEEQQLPLTEVAANNAIHGLTRWLDWTPLRWRASSVTLCQRLYPQDGYPFLLALEIEYALSDLGLTVATTATNVGDTPLPFGAGHHPYLTVGTPTIDAATLRLPASTSLETNDRLIPTGSRGVEGTDFDFREGKEIGGVQLDTCFTDVIPDEDGFARATLTHPSGSPQIILGMDPSHGFIQVYTGDTLPEEDRRRGIAIEPMTCAPNAFNSGDGLRIIAPGESFTSVWGMACV